MTDPVLRHRDHPAVRRTRRPGADDADRAEPRRDRRGVQAHRHRPRRRGLGPGDAGRGAGLPGPGDDRRTGVQPAVGRRGRQWDLPVRDQAASVVDDDTSVVAEGDLDLGRVFGLQAKLSPVASTGRWSGQHLVQFTNWGNAPVRLKLAAADPDEKLAFLLHPGRRRRPDRRDDADRPAGEARSKPFLRGQPVRLPFSVSAEPDPPEPAAMGPAGPLPVMADPRRAQVDGAFNQRPILSKWVILLALLLLAVIALLIVLAVRRTPPPPPSAALGAGVPAIPSALTVTAHRGDLDHHRLGRAAGDGVLTASTRSRPMGRSQRSRTRRQPQTRLRSRTCNRAASTASGCRRCGPKPSDLSEQACGNRVAVTVTVSGTRAVGHPDGKRTGADHRTGDRAVRSATSTGSRDPGGSGVTPPPSGGAARPPGAGGASVRRPARRCSTAPIHRRGPVQTASAAQSDAAPWRTPSAADPAEHIRPGDRDGHPQRADGAADGPHRAHRSRHPAVHRKRLDRHAHDGASQASLVRRVWPLSLTDRRGPGIPARPCLTGLSQAVDSASTAHRAALLRHLRRTVRVQGSGRRSACSSQLLPGPPNPRGLSLPGGGHHGRASTADLGDRARLDIDSAPGGRHRHGDPDLLGHTGAIGTRCGVGVSVTSMSGMTRRRRSSSYVLGRYWSARSGWSPSRPAIISRERTSVAAGESGRLMPANPQVRAAPEQVAGSPWRPLGRPGAVVAGPGWSAGYIGSGESTGSAVAARPAMTAATLGVGDPVLDPPHRVGAGHVQPADDQGEYPGDAETASQSASRRAAADGTPAWPRR